MQIMVLARVHVLFSHLEDFVRNVDLLPGPRKHRWSEDQPAYELPTGDPEARVLARHHRSKAQWLVTGWAAGGDDRDVTVVISDLGTVTLRVRACGSVYRASRMEGQPRLELVDQDGMLPTNLPENRRKTQ
jgi:hypothetical protein